MEKNERSASRAVKRGMAGFITGLSVLTLFVGVESVEAPPTRAEVNKCLKDIGQRELTYKQAPASCQNLSQYFTQNSNGSGQSAKDINYEYNYVISNNNSNGDTLATFIVVATAGASAYGGIMLYDEASALLSRT